MARLGERRQGVTEINNQIIDKPEIQSIQEFLAERKTLGIYIPAYQRYFSWGPEQFERFFEDIATDIRRESKPQHYMTFLGSIICFDDSEKMTIAPGLKSQQPERVYNIVDGQQRMIFINILGILLHKLLGSECYAELRSDNGWFNEKAEDLQNNLAGMISVRIGGKKTPSPKIIRAIVDEWAKSSEQEQFTSPTARFLNQYLKHIEENRPFKFNDRDISDENLKEEHKVFKNHVDLLEKLLKSFCKQSPPEDKEIRYELDAVEKLVSNTLLMEAAFAYDVGEDYKAGKFDFSGPNKDVKKKLFRALLLGNYIYRCVYAIVVVTRNSYDRTLTVFDALNVTGRSLNAFETFKPDVIKIDIKGYRDSESKAYVDRIEEGMKRRKDRGAVDKHVSELIVSFALANSGAKLSKDLYEQRDYLRRSFDSHVKDKEQHLRYLSFFSTVNDMKRMFEADENGLEAFLRRYHPSIRIHTDLGKDISEATFCLRFLSKAGFTITISLLSIYLHQIHTSGFDEASIAAFCDAVRKTAAFCAIWRSSAESTNRIDDRLRKIMKEDPPKGKIMRWRPLARYDYKKKAENPILSTAELGQIFVGLIEEMYEIKDAESWSGLVENIQIYKIKQVARFLLLVGSHNTRTEKKGLPSLTLVKDHSVMPLIASGVFDNPLFKTIEHIIPTKEDSDKSPYSKIDKNQLWNLTLVPLEVNSILGNKDWKRKQAIYQYYAAEDDAEQKLRLEDLKKILNKDQFQRFLKNKHRGYLPMTKYLALLEDGDFSKELGQRRSEAILANCWRILAQQWLGWSSKGNDR